MVKVKEVPEDSPYGSSDSEASGSSESLASVATDIDVVNETLLDRIVALVDIVPPQTRHNISTKVSAVARTVQKTGKVVGNIVWVITTSALLVGLPLALVLEDEAKIAQQEKEIAAQQQGQQAVCVVFCLSDMLRTTADLSHLSDAEPLGIPAFQGSTKEGFDSAFWLLRPLSFNARFITAYGLCLISSIPFHTPRLSRKFSAAHMAAAQP